MNGTLYFSTEDTLGYSHEMSIDVEFENDSWFGAMYSVLFNIAWMFGVLCWTSEVNHE